MLYGGVSLAIYINGVVQELFHLVRATAPVSPYPKEPQGQVTYFPTGAAVAAKAGEIEPLTGSELVYRKLGQLLPLDGSAPLSADIAPHASVRTRFVVDILSGSSAGGINGVFLGKAIANQQRIDALKDLWVDEGEIAVLLNDQRSYKGLPPGIERQSPARSLLNGQRLYTKIRDALSIMGGTAEIVADPSRPSYAEQLDLSVTTTDLQGLRMPIALQDRVVYEARHRHVFHFVYATEDATGKFRNDFAKGYDGMLAFAARATSSFPFAFEPVVLEDTLQVDSSFESDFGHWGELFFTDYVSRDAKFRSYAFADGGYLDNKPFTHATEALRRRRADLPVDRKLVYIEPDPGGLPTELGEGVLPADPPNPRPDVIDNVGDALTNLPRSEPIRDDIQAVFDRNQRIEELLRIMLRVEEDFRAHRDPFKPLRDLKPDAPDEEVDLALGECALFHRAYRQLRAAIVAEELTSMIAVIAGVRADSDAYRAIGLVIRVWINEIRGMDLNSFLYEFDFSYRLRRHNFLQDRISDLLRHGDRREQMLEMVEHFAAGASGAGPSAGRDVDDALRGLKLDLNDVFTEFRRQGRAMRRGEVKEGQDAIDPRIEKVHAEIEKFTHDPGRLLDVLKVREIDPARREHAQEESARGFINDHRTAIDGLGDRLSEYLVSAFEKADSGIVDHLVGDKAPPDLPRELRELLHGYYLRFDSFDAVALPLAHPDVGETNPVEVIRISPQDAISLVNETAPGTTRRKLAGAALGHFGGFFDEDWRLNDILWGRLDGAERIIQALVPKGDVRTALRKEAQGAIIREELLAKDLGRLTDLLAGALLRTEVPGGTYSASAVEKLRSGDAADREAMIEAIRALPDDVLLEHVKDTYEVPPLEDPQALLDAAGRATRLTGDIMKATSARRSLPTKPWFWVTRIGQLLWGIAEVAMPTPKRTIPGLLYRYWTQLALVIAVLLVLFGTLGIEGAQKVGWILLAAAGGVRAVVWIAEALLAPPEPPALTVDKPAMVKRRVWALRARKIAAGIALGCFIAVGVGLVIVLIGLADDDIQRVGWWIALIAAAATAVALVARGVVPSPRKAFAVVVAGLLVGTAALAVVELARHGGADISAAMGRILPGDRGDGIEMHVRDGWSWFVEHIWNRLWPW